MSDHLGDGPEPVGPEGEHDDDVYAYDSELAFLPELEREIHREARRAAVRDSRLTRGRPPRRRAREGGHISILERGRVRGEVGAGGKGESEADAHRPPAPRRARSARASARVARRSLTLVALLCLIAATAYGADRVFSTGPSSSPNPTYIPQGAFVLAAQGGTGGERWSLRLYRRGEELCRVLVVGQSEGSRCTPAPGPRALSVTSVVSPRRRYLFGVAGSDVTHVRVRAGAQAQTVPARVADPAGARAGGLPQDARSFVAVITRPVGRGDPPARMLGLDAAGRPVGRALIDCVQTPDPRRCPSP